MNKRNVEFSNNLFPQNRPLESYFLGFRRFSSKRFLSRILDWFFRLISAAILFQWYSQCLWLQLIRVEALRRSMKTVLPIRSKMENQFIQTQFQRKKQTQTNSGCFGLPFAKLKKRMNYD